MIQGRDMRGTVQGILMDQGDHPHYLRRQIEALQIELSARTEWGNAMLRHMVMFLLILPEHKIAVPDDVMITTDFYGLGIISRYDPENQCTWWELVEREAETPKE